MTTCRRLFVPEIGSTGVGTLLDLSREDQSVLEQAMTGHNFLNYPLANTGRVESNKCRLCQEDKETTLHLIAGCPALAIKRIELFYDHGVILPLSYGKLRQFVRHLDNRFQPEETY